MQLTYPDVKSCIIHKTKDMVDRGTPRTKEEARNALNFKLWHPDRARLRSALVLRVSVDDGVKKNSTSYVIKQLVHAFS